MRSISFKEGTSFLKRSNWD